MLKHDNLLINLGSFFDNFLSFTNFGHLHQFILYFLFARTLTILVVLYGHASLFLWTLNCTSL